MSKNAEIVAPLGVDDPAELFRRFHRLGERELSKIREITERATPQAETRTWGTQQAAEMIGRSEPWLREHDPDAPRNRQGHARWDLHRINQIRDAIGTRYRRPAGSPVIKTAFFNFKGGVSKTTSCANLAHKLAIEGFRVLVIDLDPQASLTYVLGRIIPELDLGEEDVLNETLLNDLSLLPKLIRKTRFPGVDLIPTNLQLQGLDLVLPNPELNNRDQLGPAASRLARALQQVEDQYDVILFDCAPNMGAVTANAMYAANSVIVPLPPASFDRASFVQLCQHLALYYSQVPHSLLYLRILVSQHKGTSSEIFNESRIRALYGEHVLANVLQDSAEISKAHSQMSTVYDLEKPISSRDTYQRAIDMLDRLNMEIINDFKRIWENSHG